MSVCGCPLSRSLLGAKRTCLFALHMSAFDPKRTWPGSMLGPLSLCRAFAADSRGKWLIEYIATRGAELLLMLNKALFYAARVRDSVPAKPPSIWRACICIRLRISSRRQRTHDHGNENHSAEFTHSVLLPIWVDGPYRKTSVRLGGRQIAANHTAEPR